MLAPFLSSGSFLYNMARKKEKINLIQYQMKTKDANGLQYFHVPIELYYDIVSLYGEKVTDKFFSDYLYFMATGIERNSFPTNDYLSRKWESLTKKSIQSITKYKIDVSKSTLNVGKNIKNNDKNYVDSDEKLPF